MLMANPPVDKVGRRNTVIIFVCILLVFGVLIWIFLRPFIRAETDRKYRTLDGIPTPAQFSITGKTDLHGEDWSGVAIHRAKYIVWGLVINNTPYSGDSLYDKISPLDIGLAWGDMAKNNHLVKWTQGTRHVTASINALYKFFIPKDNSVLFRQYSNNHLVFTDEELLKKAQSLQLGDYVRIKGYLVDVTAHRKKEPAIKYDFKTSLTREDEGEDSCEVLLVTRIDVLD